MERDDGRPEDQPVAAVPIQLPVIAGPLPGLFDEEMLVYESRCKICSCVVDEDGDPAPPNARLVRQRIRELAVALHPARAIYQQVSPMMADWPLRRRFSRQGLSNHITNHLRGREQAMIAAARQEAGLDAAVVEDEARRSVSSAVGIRMLAEMALDDLARGRIKLNAADAIRIFVLLRDYEEEDFIRRKYLRLESDTAILASIIEEVVEPDQRLELARRMQAIVGREAAAAMASVRARELPGPDDGAGEAEEPEEYVGRTDRKGRPKPEEE